MLGTELGLDTLSRYLAKTQTAHLQAAHTRNAYVLFIIDV